MHIILNNASQKARFTKSSCFGSAIDISCVHLHTSRMEMSSDLAVILKAPGILYVQKSKVGSGRDQSDKGCTIPAFHLTET